MGILDLLDKWKEIRIRSFCHTYTVADDLALDISFQEDKKTEYKDFDRLMIYKPNLEGSLILMCIAQLLDLDK